eukprot:COSAG01_NODE_9471_length_2437_cov_5.369119_4_plen_42_part_01
MGREKNEEEEEEEWVEWKFLRVAEGADEAQRHAAVVREQRDH